MGKKLKIKKQNIRNYCLILFLCIDVVYWVIQKILSVLQLQDFYWIITIAVIYIPLIIYFCITSVKEFPVDFLIIVLGIILLYAVTAFFHPEYQEWFHHPVYGVWKRILRPDRGLFLYLFLRIQDDPDEILNCMKIAGYIMFFYCARTFVISTIRGYWLVYSAQTLTNVEASYSMDFGYDLLLTIMIFSYLALYEKKIRYYLVAGISFAMCLIAGSRGPLLCIGIFGILILIEFMRNNIKRLMIVLGSISIAFALIWFNFSRIIEIIQSVLSSFGISSRSIQMILEGNVTDNNGRTQIYEMAWSLIQENPITGWGLYGDRYVIGRRFAWGYSHNIFLELMVTFGVVIAVILSLIFFINATRLIIFSKNRSVRILFIICLSISAKLLISMSFWYEPYFWGAIAIFVNWEKRKGKFRVNRGKLIGKRVGK